VGTMNRTVVPSVGTAPTRGNPGGGPPRGAASRRRAERGLVMMSVLGMVLVLTVFAMLVLTVAGKEVAFSGLRLQSAGSLYVAEGGAVAGRAALMAFVDAYPVGVTTVDPSLTGTTAAGWYANGSNASQNPFGPFDYFVIDGQRFTLGAIPSTPSETFQVNWGLGTSHLKLQTGGTPLNSLGGGTYASSVVLTPNPTPDASCSGGAAGPPCAIHQLGPNDYEIFYKYIVTSNGNVPPYSRRAVTLTGSFSVQLRLQNFAMYALFTNAQTTPSGSSVWFTNNTSFNGPVHTNGEFNFAFFPTFTDKVESVSTRAWYNNNGNPTQLSNNENVSSGTRIDAPLVPPDPNPQAATPANFTRGARNVPLPNGPYSQQGVAVGLNPSTSSAPSTAQIDAAIPELTGSGSVPTGIYVPVTDSSGQCLSQPGDPLAGGIYVQGSLDSLTMSVSGSTSNTATYSLVQGSTTTTITVDRAANTTTVTSNNWLPSPLVPGCPSTQQTGPTPTRVFNGVPKGYQGPGEANATIVYVNGAINSLSGTLGQNEQTTIAASGTITITGNIQDQTPPNPSDPTSNPTNLLGVYSSGGDIVIGSAAPNNLVIQAVLMAGSTGSSYNSSVNVANYNSGSPRGSVNLLGGLIEKYYGAFGTFNSQTGQQATGYGRAFTFDTRMSRGFAPPYFPTTNEFMITPGSQPLAGVKANWREATPP
jgi:hypothetical protein